MKIITYAEFQMTSEGFTLLCEESYEHAGAVAKAKGGSAPAAPDPAVEANAQAAANRYNTVGPSGSTQWQQGGVQVIGYDSEGRPQYGQDYTQVTTLAPEEQHQYDIRNQISDSLLGAANTQIPQFVNTPFSYDTATPEVAKAQYDKNLALLQPEFDKSNRQLDQKLANQGLPIGSEAYADAMRVQEQGQNSARQQIAADAVTQGNNLSLSERNQRYNELAAALGSDQVQSPAGGNFTPIDVTGAYNNKFQSQLADYNNAQAEQQGNTAAAAGLGAAAIIAF